MHKPVYMDHQATTPLDPRVLEAMMPYFVEKFGNAASRNHHWGTEAEEAVDMARRQIAELAGARPREIIFTSGATESDNLAIMGSAEMMLDRGRHVITVATEHKAVLDPFRRLGERGWRVTILSPEPDGLLDVAELERCIASDTVLVSVMFANNEIGVIQPIREIGALCRERGVVFHCDAVQAFGKVPISVVDDHIDLMSVSAHKMYGPKGVGALYIRRGHPHLRIAPQILGGGHERGFRSGTLNVPGVVGFGAACAIAAREQPTESDRLGTLRDRLLNRLTSELAGVAANGCLRRRLPQNLNLSFAGVDNEALLMAMPDIGLSTGSACSSASIEPSHVLKAIGASEDAIRGSVRFSLGRWTTSEDVDYVTERIIETVRELRALCPVHDPTAEFSVATPRQSAAPAKTGDHDGLLAKFARLHVWSRGGQRAPHKPLLILYALGRLQSGAARLIRFEDLEKPLARLLYQFGPKRAAGHPEYPFIRLQNDGIWEVPGHERFVRRRGHTDPLKSELLRAHASGGFPEAIYLQIKAQPLLIQTIAREILTRHFPASLHNEITGAVGLKLQ